MEEKRVKTKVFVIVLEILILLAMMGTVLAADSQATACPPKLVYDPNGALIIAACVSSRAECPFVLSGTPPDDFKIQCILTGKSAGKSRLP